MHTLIIHAKEPIISAITIFQIKSKSLKEVKKDSILNHIYKNPGCIVSDITKKLFISGGDVRYYVLKFEKDGKIIQRKIGKFKRLFSRSPALTEAEKSLFSIVNNETNKIMLKIIIDNNGITNHEISEITGLEKSNIHRRMKLFISNDLIISKKEGRFKHYYLKNEYRDAIVKMINHFNNAY